MLIKVPPKRISRMINCLVTCTDETASFYKIMSVIKSWCCKIFINWMDLKSFKRINWSNRMLPNVSNNIIKSLSLEHINRIRREPILKINISNLTIIPSVKIFLKQVSNSVILIFCWKSKLFASFLTFPLAKGLGFKVVNFYRPVPWNLDNPCDCSQIIYWLSVEILYLPK